VFTIERIRPLFETARRTLSDLGYTNILFKAFDGTLGWKEHAPFDAVLVTAGAPQVPKPLLDQLTQNGRLVIPVGNRFNQELIKMRRKGGGYTTVHLGGCRFVDLVGLHGWKA
jgi:protein-L-isoaspartate(D-aspartate) O-methyltransferase